MHHISSQFHLKQSPSPLSKSLIQSFESPAICWAIFICEICVFLLGLVSSFLQNIVQDSAFFHVVFATPLSNKNADDIILRTAEFKRLFQHFFRLFRFIAFSQSKIKNGRPVCKIVSLLCIHWQFHLAALLVLLDFQRLHFAVFLYHVIIILLETKTFHNLALQFFP